MLQLSPVRSEKLLNKTSGSEDEQIQTSDVVQLCLRGLQDDLSLYLTAFAVPVICSPLQNQAVQFAHQNYPHLEGLQLADCTSESSELEIDILIGSDNYWNFVTGNIKRGLSGPVALQTKLGWVLSGPVHATGGPATTSVNYITAHTLRTDTFVSDETSLDGDVRLEDQVAKFWELESIGIQPVIDTVHHKFLENILYKGERYEVRLPWREGHALLPDNYKLSVNRLRSLIKRLRNNRPDILHEYDQVIKEQFRKGVIEEIPNEDQPCVGKVHYLPHHGVVREDKDTTKLRVVYDASSPPGGVSLNSCLHTGPQLTPNLVDILLRFRWHKTALIGDIEKAFLMVSVSEEDRDVLRFLWVDDIAKEKPEIVVRRFSRVVFGVNCSPFLLNGTIRHHVSKYMKADPEFTEQFLQSLYVDDLTSGADDVNHAFEIYTKVKTRMLEAGFNMRKWISNSSELLKRIEQCEVTRDETQSTKPVAEDEETYTRFVISPWEEVQGQEEHKTLGVVWNYLRDKIVFRLGRFPEMASTLMATKRNILSITSRIYDPLGLISPVVTIMKTLFQEICIDKASWDAPLREDLEKIWREWLADLSTTQEIEIPRCYFSRDCGGIQSAELHGFGDASSYAYAAVVYLRVWTGSEFATSLVASKTRVATLTSQTIPRLELLAALILARLITCVHRALESVYHIDKLYCWSDSITTIYWIKGERCEWKQHVQNRVDEIRALVEPNSWRHCPGKDNPADIPSRGLKASQLVNEPLWFDGPQWLRQPENFWPSSEKVSLPTDDSLQERKSESRKLHQTTTVNLTVSIRVNLQEVIPVQKFGSVQKLFRITAYVLRFIHNARHKQQDRETGALSTKEIIDAERIWIKETQQTIDTSKLEQSHSNLGLFKDTEGVIRCKGRLMNANLPYSSKHPALLPGDHYLVHLIIADCHERVMHNGVKETLAELRTQYWITKGRQVVHREIFRCNQCRKVEGRSFSVPAAGQLPQFRLEDNHPFTNTGVDFAGPLYIKNTSDPKSAMSKAYIALYTCASTRAVHLELTPDMSATTFLRSFRRFVSRRGVPALMISDNFKSFKTVSGKLGTVFESPEVQSLLGHHKIEWKFNLAKAPWWGRFFERMVKCTKRCLKKVLGNAKLTYEELLTVLTEVEAVLNSRPLTYVYTDEIEEPLTPSHLLMGKRLMNIPDVDRSENVAESDRESLVRRARYQKLLSEHFWKRWRREYLLSLREQHRLDVKKGVSKEVRVGDIVTVHEEGKSRCLWRLGRIEKLIFGQDNKIRGAAVRVGQRERKSTVIQRPLQKLYPLEVQPSTEPKGGDHSSLVGKPPNVKNQEPDPVSDVAAHNQIDWLPRRRAAVEAEKRLKQIAQS